MAVNQDEQRIRFGTCRRNAEKLTSSVGPLTRSAERFLAAHPRFQHWKAEYVAIAPTVDRG